MEQLLVESAVHVYAGSVEEEPATSAVEAWQSVEMLSVRSTLCGHVVTLFLVVTCVAVLKLSRAAYLAYRDVLLPLHYHSDKMQRTCA